MTTISPAPSGAPAVSVPTPGAQSTPAPSTIAPAAPAQAPATTPEAPKADQERVAGRLAVLTKKEAAAVRAQQEAKALQAQIAEREKAIAAREAELEGLKGDPLGILKKYGYDYNQVTQAYLNNGQLPPEVVAQKTTEEIRAEVQGLKQRMEDERKAAEDAQAEAARQEEARAIEGFKGQIRQEVSDQSKYPFIAHFNQGELVYDLIDEHHRRSGRVMEIPEAAKLLEDHIRDQVTKARDLLPPPQPAHAPVMSAPQAPKRDLLPPSKPTTLTNRTTAPITPAAPKPRVRTDEERIKAALEKYGRR